MWVYCWPQVFSMDGRKETVDREKWKRKARVPVASVFNLFLGDNHLEK